ncbi:MAG: hypothetical protein JWM04_91 [Verrucomicrobiales bacterium]|nr:hypothetical protein [Verrucomicrobiales bacterium]
MIPIRHITRFCLSLLFGFQLVSRAYAQAAPEQQQSTGLRRPNAAEQEWMDKNLVRTHKVLINPLAAQRIKQEQGNNGPAVSSVEYGSEIPNQNSPVLETVAGSSILPSFVDNSTLPSFPPVRSQGSIGSCASFSTVYYVGTHMLGLVRGFNNKNDADNSTKLSPKWTYPMVNGGQDSGSWFTPTFDVLIKHGGATWADFPYSGINTPNSYREWCRDGTVWRKAIDFRFNQSGTVPDLDTPTGLNNLKTLLADGYCLLYATDIYGWQYTNISDDPATAADDAYAGKQACYVAKADSSGHAMTVVGYNDNIWVDINKNGVVDPGEKGALLICNSWGTGWKAGGFTWVAYDALKQVSTVPGADNSNRVPVWWDSQAYWINAKPNYAPKIMAQFTVNQLARNEINVTLGSSTTAQTSPTTFFYPGAIQSQGGAFAFDGTTTPVNGTFVFDFTDLVQPINKRYYLKVTDYSSGRITTVSDFRLIDAGGNTLAVASTGIPSVSDASTATPYLDFTYNPPVINSSSTTNAMIGAAFSYQVTGTGNPTSFGANGLPAGLRISTSTGLITGTPTQAGLFQVSLTANNANGSGVAVLSLTVSTSIIPAPTITSASTVTGNVGTPLTYTITANGSPTTFSAEGLSSDFSFSSTTGVINGIPTEAGIFTVLITANNAGGGGSKTLTLNIGAQPPSSPAITSPATATISAGSAFNYRIIATGNPTTYGADGLPGELSISPSTGLIQGTLTVARQYAITLRATNPQGTGYQLLTLTVLGDSSFGPPNDNFANRTVMIGTNIAVSGGNNNGTAQAGEPAHGGLPAQKSVWWTWTAPTTGQVTVSTAGSTFDTVLAVYTGSSVDHLTLIGSDDQSGGQNTSLLTFNAVAGFSYHIAVDGYAGDSGSIALSLKVVGGSTAAPVNDLFANRISLSGKAISTSEQNNNASAELNEPAHDGNPASHSVWWSWTAPDSGTVTLDTIGSSFDTLLAVYTGNTLASLHSVASDDQSGGNNTCLIHFLATAGTTYQFAVDGYNGGFGNIVLNLQMTDNIVVPPNDDFEERTALFGANILTTGTSVNATAESGEPNHSNYSPYHSVWWSWSAPQSGTVTIDTHGSTFDTVLAVYKGFNLGELVEVLSNDDANGENTSSVSFAASAGTPYQIAVDGFGGQSGGVTLSIQFHDGAPSNDQFQNRTLISGTNVVVNGFNADATAQAGEPQHAGRDATKSIWWTWTAPVAGRVTLATKGSTFDTLLDVYTGTTLANLVPVVSNDDYSGISSRVTFLAKAGQSYEISVDGYEGDSGDVHLSLEFAAGSGTFYETDFQGFTPGIDNIEDTEGWLGDGVTSGVSGIINGFPEFGQAGYLGFGIPRNQVISLYRSININPINQGTPFIVFSVDMEVVNSNNGHFDQFGFAIYNQNVDVLGSVIFDNSTRHILHFDGNSTHDTGHFFTNNVHYQLTVIMNFANRTWSGSMDGTKIFNNVAFNLPGFDMDLADIDPQWTVKSLATPGNNYLLFDNFSIVGSATASGPTIISEPQNVSIAAGGIANFSVNASGLAPFTYQWRWNNSNIQGQNGPSLSLLNVATNQFGDYSVVVSNFFGSAISRMAALTVTNIIDSSILNDTKYSSRGMQFQVSGGLGQTFKLDVSTDLVTWVEIATLFNQNGTLTYLDPTATNSVRRFYRLRQGK